MAALFQGCLCFGPTRVVHASGFNKKATGRRLTDQPADQTSWHRGGVASITVESSAGQLRSQAEARRSPFKVGCGNDPSAGSPTETLLRLHLPLDDEV